MRKSLLIILIAIFLTNCQLGASLWDNANNPIQNPDIININPSDGDIVTPDTDLTIIFSKNIEPLTLGSAITITSMDNPGIIISKSISYDSTDMYIATITPAYNGYAVDGAKFSVHISNEIKDKQGNNLFSSISYSYSIGINTTHPRVEVTSPDTSDEINSLKRIAIIFSSAIKIGSGDIKVFQNDISLTSSQVSINWHDPQSKGFSHILRIIPLTPYLPGATIEIQLLGLSSPEGSPLEGQNVFQFTVKSE